jgi:hypothetical protein
MSLCVLTAPFFLYVLCLMTKAAANGPNIRQKSPKYLFGMLFIGLLAFGPLGLGIWYLGGDYLLPRISIEGPIHNLRVQRHHRMPDEFIVKIQGREYKATKRLFASLHAGEMITAEIGKGSGYIFNVSR